MASHPRRLQRAVARVRLIASLYALVCLAACVNRASADDMAQAELAERLKREYSAVRTMECEYELVVPPTAAAAIPLIHVVCARRGRPDDAVSYICTDKMAKGLSYDARFWRDGRKERTDYQSHAEGRPERTEAYDDETVRSLYRADRRGYINTFEGVHWHDTNRLHPAAFLFEYVTTPFWQIVRDGGGYSSEVIERDGAPYRKVFVHHPKIAHCTFELVFDADGRLCQRDLRAKVFSEHPVFLIQRHEFSDYAEFRDDEGHVIHFPRRAVYHYYMGELDDGTPAEWKTDTIRIKKVAFNNNIDPEVFAPTFPDDFEVRDLRKLRP